MKRIIVTGGSGKAGRATMKDLKEHGYDVLNVDVNAPRGRDQLNVDLTNFGETVEVLAGADAVVHLAAIPAPNISTEEVTFRTNITSTFNVFEACQILWYQTHCVGIQRNNTRTALR